MIPHPCLRRVSWLAALIVLALTAGTAIAATVPEEAYQALSWRLAGPFRGGWATAVAGVPGDPTTFYFGGADGGVWRTTDAGSTWQPLFDHGGSASIGALAVAPSDPRVIWIGTGQIQQRWDIVDGDGVYRSLDGGESWEHLGLEKTRHVGALWVDPRSADTALVAALGPVFGPGGQRGVYRTEDGGRSWSRVLYLDEGTGAADLAADPAHPDTLFASLWEVRRHPWLDYFQPTVGEGSGIWRSSDGGKSWEPVAGRGLPPEPLGRIELAVAPETGSRRLWAAVDTAEGGGLFRSEDAGATWEKVNDDTSLAGSYMGWLTSDPADPETVWAGGQPLRRSTDGGRSFEIVRSSPGGDDYHALWIDPTDSRRMITGADQGAVISLNGGASWSRWYNQPTGQFYRLAVDDGFPYRIYSGQQDSGTVSLASRSDYGQLSFRDWNPVGGHERDGDIPDPEDPDIVYGAGLGGYHSRWNARTGQVKNISPWPVGSYADDPRTVRYRYDWITPIAVDPLPPHALYQGAQLLFRSLDRGEHWEIVSPDLTGKDPEAADCAGDVPVERATVCGFGTIQAIAPSPVARGLVWVGTTNGRVHLTRDGGASWTEVTPPELGDWTKVNVIDASPTDPGTAYLAVDRHRLDDLRPLAFRTHDFGATWTEIGHALPAGSWVGVVRQDPEVPSLLYAGTHRGAHVSFDDGASWQSLQLDLPTTGINDLLVHRGDLIVATQGRAIWILDDVGPLRELARGYRVGEPLLVPPAPAYRLRFNLNNDTPLPPEEATGENPPAGAILDYLLPAGSQGPVELEIRDARGALVRRFRSDEAPNLPEARVYFAPIWLGDLPRLGEGPGHHRFVWDLREPRPAVLRGHYSIAAVPGLPTPVLPLGPFVLPGDYEVRLTVGETTLSRPLEVRLDPRVEVEPGELEELLAFQREVDTALEKIVAQARAGGEAIPEDLQEAASMLASLASDLGSSDSAPTEAQRQMLAAAVAKARGDAR